MSRRYDEPIEVTSALARMPRTSDPEAFIWRGRLFVVRAVVDRWQERRAWWREVGREIQVRAEGGGASPEPARDRGRAGGDVGSAGGSVGRAGGSVGRAGGSVGSAADSGGAAGSGGGVGAARHERERQVWRVEASAGKAAGTGVFDIGADGLTPEGSQRWLLLRAHD